MKSDLIRQKFHELHSVGLPYADIAKELAVSLRTLGYWAAEMCLARRRSGPRRQRWMPNKKPEIHRL